MALNRGRLFAGALFAGALFGVQDVAPPVEPPVQIIEQSPGAGWASSNSVGTGYVKTNNGWVKALKLRGVGGKAYPVSAHTASGLWIDKTFGTAISISGNISTINNAYGSMANDIAKAYELDGSAGVSNSLDLALFEASVKDGSVTWFSADELLIITETMT